MFLLHASHFEKNSSSVTSQPQLLSVALMIVLTETCRFFYMNSKTLILGYLRMLVNISSREIYDLCVCMNVELIDKSAMCTKRQLK